MLDGRKGRLFMIKVAIEINTVPIRTIFASRIGPLRNEPREQHVYNAEVIDHETSEKAQFRVTHEYAKGSLKLAEKLCATANRKI
jgi:hypothetical protein